MSGWNTIQRLARMQEEIEKLGFKFSKPKHGDWERQEQSISLIPKDLGSVPIYNREAEVFVGSLESLEYWLQGVRWAREYDTLLRLSDDKKRARKEQDERNRQLMRTIKNSKIAEGIEQ
jgi:hypothetical protein